MAAKSRFSISAVVNMVDRVSAPLKRATMSVNQFAAAANKRINRTLGRGARAAMFGLGAGTAMAARQYVLFDDAIFGATARFKDAQKSTDAQRKVMEKLRKTARAMGRDTQFSATLMAEGLNKFALAGFTSAEAMASLRSQVDLATVTGEDFMRVADISSDLLGSFGGAALDSAKKIKMLKEMNALLAVGTLSANVTLEDLFETLKVAAPIATMAGIGMKDIIATTSVLGSAGIKGSMAATALKNIFLRLVKPTGGVSSALRELNLNQRDFVIQSGKNKGALKSTAEIFSLIGERTKGMEKVKVAKLFAELAGLRGTAGAAVIAKNIDQLNAQLIRMGEDPKKAMGDAAAFMRKSFGVKLQILLSTTTDKFFTLFSAFDKEGRQGIDSLTAGVKNFDMGPIVSSIKMAASVFGFMFGIIKPFLPFIVGLVIVLKTWAIAQAAVNLVMSLNPIGMIVVAIGALIVGIVALVQNWEKVKKSFKETEWGRGLIFILDGVDQKISSIINKFKMISALMAGDFTGARKFAIESLTPGLPEDIKKKIIFGSASPNVRGSDKKTQPGFTEDINKKVMSSFASPNSRGINNNTTTKGTIDLNVNANGADVTKKEKGIIPGNFTLATGTQN